ncbi:MAG TPA: CoA pyrophosphatase [Pirellulales bacterium]
MNNDLIELLSSRLHQPLPGLTAQRTMEPELGYGRYGGPALPDARPASVVALLHLINGQWHLPLILRPESLTHHAGQISLPGGIIEQGETSEEAALRELEEELGIPRFDTLLLGQLSPLFLYGTNFLITPWIAALGGTRVFQPSAAEVEEILQVPLAHLIDQRSRGQHVEQRGSLQFKVPHFDWRGHQIWGATSMILAELMAVMNEIAA